MASSTTLPQPGEIIAGKYRVEHTLGSGGMGIVYQVTHCVTGKRFALKWLLPEASARADSAKRFIREAQVAGRLEHPHVVQVYDVGADGESFYMVMELLEGESLASRMERDGPLSFADACRLLIPCMRGVAEAHAAGIVHRDLKPANLFVCRATKEMPERAKVLDFGISKMAVLPGEINAAMTKTGVSIGTPYYMPLEQMRGRPVDHRADIYAFGVVLFQVLSGKLPYQAESFSDLVLLVAEDSPRRLDQVVRSLPAGLANVVRKAMAREPEQRYQSLSELVEALSSFAPLAADSRSSRRRGDSTPTNARDRGEAAADESLALPTPLSTESKPDIPALPAFFARRRGPLIAVITSLVAAGELIAFTMLGLKPDGAPPLRPKPSDETSVGAAQTPRASASSAPEQDPRAIPSKPSEAAAQGTAGIPSEPRPLDPASDDTPQIDIVRLGGDPPPAPRTWQPPSTADGRPAGANQAQSLVNADTHKRPRKPAKKTAKSTPAPAGETKVDQKPQAPARPTSKLPSIDERDFY